MKVGDLIRDWLRGYIGLFLELDDGGYFAKILWLDGKTGWVHTANVKVINHESR